MGAESKKKKRHTKTWIFLYLTVLVILYLVIYAFPKVTGALTPTTVLTYNKLKVTDEVTCYLVRDEQVYTAERGGVPTYYIPEGTLARKGAKVLDVTTAGAIKGYTCEKNGTVSYFIDGSEGYFTPENINSLKESQAAEKAENPESTIRNSVLAGEPLYKLVGSDVWYAVFWVDQSSISKYNKDSAVTLELPMGDVPGTIYNIVDDGELWEVVLRFDRYYEDMAKLRKVQATVVTEDIEGLLVPNESLVTVDKQLGVYVKSISGEYGFMPVKVLTTDGENSLVKDSYYYDSEGKKVNTVEIYDEILKSGKP